MRSPKSLEILAEHGIIQEVLRPLMSGKEAQIYMVLSDDRVCAAKIYKEAQNRSFKHRTDYMEGRKVRNSRDQRAMAKGSAYGKSKDEESWRTTEVDMIYRLRAAGVRVPEPYVFMDGVLLMELVCDENGDPAPRLGDVSFTPKECTEIFHLVLQEVVRMLCAGVVHGDLSDFNVLLSHDGPVIIDFPQSVEAAGNLNARRLLLRDVDNLHRFLSRFVPGARRLPYGEEIWSLYESNQLAPETRLTGSYRHSSARVDTGDVLALIRDANRDELRRRGLSHRGEPDGGGTEGGSAGPTIMRRREVIIERPPARGAGGRHPSPDNHSGTSGGAGGQGEPGRPGGGGGASMRAAGRRPNQAKSARPQPPKRGGNAAPASVYVSPEARKTKVLSLTPRSTAGSGAAREATPPGGRGPRRDGPSPDRNRDNRGRPQAAERTTGRGGPRRAEDAPRGGQPRATERAAHQGDPRPGGSSEHVMGERRARARARREERMKGPALTKTPEAAPPARPSEPQQSPRGDERARRPRGSRRSRS